MNMHNQKKVLLFLKKKRVITSSELAKYLGVSWNTAEKYLLELGMSGEVEKFKKSGVNIWLQKNE